MKGGQDILGSLGVPSTCKCRMRVQFPRFLIITGNLQNYRFIISVWDTIMSDIGRGNIS